MIDTDDWTEIDPLWESRIDSETTSLAESIIRRLEQNRETEWWKVVDVCWNGCIEDDTTLLRDSSTHRMATGRQTEHWTEVDVWWTEYTDNKKDYASELTGVIEALSEQWSESPSRFDEDPLTTDWRHEPLGAPGPLRTNHEENWSQWLAHLIRQSSGEFTSQLFGEEFDRPPRTVQREETFQNKSGKNRRIDVLCEYIGRDGVSIEVKIDDENYGKTTETAALIEQQTHGDWLHVLLLPGYKESSLQSTFSDELIEREDGTYIQSSDSEDILVLYWRDVGEVLRRTLLEDGESSPHWDSSAYLMVTLIEQVIRSFEPVSVEDYSIEISDSTGMWGLKSTELDDQINYLERVIQGDKDE